MTETITTNENTMTDAQKATLENYPYIKADQVIDCPKCDGSGETIPDHVCKSCSGTGIKNFEFLVPVSVSSVVENQPKEEKIKRLIQREIDRYDREFWQDSSSRNHDVAFIKSVAKVTLSKLLKEIETL